MTGNSEYLNVFLREVHPAGRMCVGDHSASGSAARRMVNRYVAGRW